jgi:hypothetical protein
MELALIIGPVFAVYVAAIVRKLVSMRETEWDSSRTHPGFSILAVGTGIVFSIAVPVTLLAFIQGGITTFADLKNTLGVIEAALGLYTGAIIDALFGMSRIKPKPKPTRRP